MLVSLFALSPQPESNRSPLPYQGSALPTELCGQHLFQRAMGIEPTLSAWKAEVLPLNYARIVEGREWRGKDSNLRRRKPSDLQSDPFGRSGTPPENQTCILRDGKRDVKHWIINHFFRLAC